MDAYLAVVSKREVRDYAPRPLEPAAERRILEAGRVAGSSKNRQGRRFVVVRDDGAGSAIVNATVTLTGTDDLGAMKAITGCACTGFELHAVVQGDDIVILKLPSTTTDPMAREEVTRIKTPGGAAIEAGT